MKLKDEYTKKETPYPIVCARNQAKTLFNKYQQQLYATMNSFLNLVSEDIIDDFVGKEV